MQVGFSLSKCGVALLDTCLRFLKEDPWTRLVKIEKKSRIFSYKCFCAATMQGYTNYLRVVHEFIKEACRNGLDVFRIFDCFNHG